MAQGDERSITVGMLKQHLDSYSDDDELDFGGLTFYRLKRRGPKLVQVEFSQSVYRDAQGRVVVDNHE
jgi:hypothetical protein